MLISNNNVERLFENNINEVKLPTDSQFSSKSVTVFILAKTYGNFEFGL